ncbi:MAG TPA: hypothetical protein VI911_04390 [Patescibacteria group bacterium]|nr:hypothetical protein [Patescibacteria group bacterium]
MATPLIRPTYDPHFDMGTPAIVSYWAAFIGERQRMFNATMEARLAQMDPKALSDEIRDIDKQIAQIIKSRDNLRLSASAKFGDIVKVATNSAGMVAAATARGQATVEAAKIGAEVDLEEIAAEERTAQREIANLSSESEAHLGEMVKNVASMDDPAMAREQAKQTYERIRAEEGIQPGSVQDRALRYKVGLYLNAAASLSPESAAGAEATRWGEEHFGGRTPVEWAEAQFGPLSPEAAAARRQRVMSHGVGGLGERSSSARSGGSVGTSGGGPGVGVSGAGSWQDWYDTIVKPGAEQSEAELADLRKRRDDLVAERARIRAQGGADLFAGYGFNYLLETPFQTPARGSLGRLGRLQAGLDMRADTDPVVRGEADTYILRNRGNPEKAAAEASQDYRLEPGAPAGLPIPYTAANRAGDEDKVLGLTGVHDWLYDELAAIRGLLADPATVDEGGQRLLALKQSTASLLDMDPGLYADAPALFDNLAKAIDALTMATGQADRVVDDDNGTYRYLQRADGSVYFVALDAEGTPTSDQATLAKGDAAAAIVKMIGQHPAQRPRADVMGEVVADLGTAAATANDRARDDVYFSEVAANALADAHAAGDTDEAVQRIYDITSMTQGMPPELVGSFGRTLVEIERRHFNAGDRVGLRNDTLNLSRQGWALGADERESVSREDIDTRRDAIEAQRLKDEAARGRLAPFEGPPNSGAPLGSAGPLPHVRVGPRVAGWDVVSPTDRRRQGEAARAWTPDVGRATEGVPSGQTATMPTPAPVPEPPPTDADRAASAKAKALTDIYGDMPDILSLQAEHTKTLAAIDAKLAKASRQTDIDDLELQRDRVLTSLQTLAEAIEEVEAEAAELSPRAAPTAPAPVEPMDRAADAPRRPKAQAAGPRKPRTTTYLPADPVDIARAAQIRKDAMQAYNAKQITIEQMRAKYAEADALAAP